MHSRPGIVVHLLGVLSGVVSGSPFAKPDSLCTPVVQPSAGHEGQMTRERSSSPTTRMTNVA